MKEHRRHVSEISGRPMPELSRQSYEGTIGAIELFLLAGARFSPFDCWHYLWAWLAATAALARREDLRLAETKDRRAARNTASGSTTHMTPATTTPTKPMSSTEPLRGASAVWTLSIVDKRRKQRTVPVSGATIAALRAHWHDRERDLDAPRAQGPLIAPQWIPGTRSALERHDADAGDAPYTVDALGRLVRMAVQRLTKETAALAELSTDELVQLANTSAHAFRHNSDLGISGIRSARERSRARCRPMWCRPFWVVRRCRPH